MRSLEALGSQSGSTSAELTIVESGEIVAEAPDAGARSEDEAAAQ